MARYLFTILSGLANLSLNRTIYAPHTPRPLRCNERVIDHYDLHLVQDIGSGRALMAEYIGPSNAEPGMRHAMQERKHAARVYSRAAHDEDAFAVRFPLGVAAVLQVD